MADQNTAASTLTDDERKAIAQMPYEEARDKLIEAVQALEAGGLNLDQSMRQWDLRSQIRVAYGAGCTEESSSVAKYGRCAQTATHKSHWRSSMRRANGNRHTRDRISVAVCGQRPKRATTDQRPTSMVASRAA